MRIIEILQEYDATDQRIRYRRQNYDYTTLKRAQNRRDPNYDPEWDSAPDSEIPSKQADKAVKGNDGPGWYSGGQTNPRDPHEFVKRPHLTTLMDEDAYYAYIMEIRDLKRQGYHNSFFPQVYNIDITQDPKGNQRPRYRIEKLQKGEDYSFEALVGLYERLFMNEVNINAYEKFSNPEFSLWSDMARELTRAVERSNYTNIRDDELREALMLISKIVDDHDNWNVDLHANNIRVRGSRTGPQLVLMDPISDGGYSIPGAKDIMYGPKMRSRRMPPPPPK